MNNYEINYRKLLVKAFYDGIYKMDRTGVGCYTITGEMLKVDLSEGFPFLTGRKMFFKNPVNELLWFINGETNIKRFKEAGVNIWNAWALQNGELGPVYGYQMRNFNGQGFDQLKNILKRLVDNPSSRRHIINIWNPIQENEMQLPPCHYSHQYVIEKDKLNLTFNMRSVDIYLGLPYDIAMYALLLKVVAMYLNLKPGTLTFFGTDCHIYDNHKDAITKYLRTDIYDLPKVIINENVKESMKGDIEDIFNRPGDLFELTKKDFKLLNYKCGKHISAPVAI